MVMWLFLIWLFFIGLYLQIINLYLLVSLSPSISLSPSPPSYSFKKSFPDMKNCMRYVKKLNYPEEQGILKSAAGRGQVGGFSGV